MTQAEIFAVATLLKIQIFAFPCQPGSQEYHWLCYKPLRRGYSVSKCPKSVQKLWKLTLPSNYHIELIHSFQNHFDRIASSDLTQWRRHLTLATALIYYLSLNS